MPKKKPVVISVVNQKGGVGKTTTVANLAVSLAEKKHSVLVIDFDYQANVTSLLCGDEQFDDPQKSITFAIKNDLTLKDVVVPTPYKNLDILPSNRELDALRDQMVGQPNQFSLVSHIMPTTQKNRYDYIIIDTHPSLDCFFQSSIAASNYFLIPMFAEADSSRGLAHQIQAIEKIKKFLNPKLGFLGALIVRYDKYNATHQKFEKLIREYGKNHEVHVFKSVIPNSHSVAAAAALNKPICYYKKSSPAALAYNKFAGELATQAKKLNGQKPKKNLQAQRTDVELEVMAEL